jgi:hypothetical protein
MTYGSRLSVTVRGGIVMRWLARCGLDRTVCYSGGMLGRPTHGWARAVRLGLAWQAGLAGLAGPHRVSCPFSDLNIKLFYLSLLYSHYAKACVYKQIYILPPLI